MDANSGGEFSLKICENSLRYVLPAVLNSVQRESLYRAAHHGYAVNGLPLLGVAERHKLSQILGKELCARMQFEVRLAVNPDNVKQFLIHLSQLIAPKVEEENNSLRSYQGPDANSMLRTWDHAFHARGFAVSSFRPNVFLTMQWKYRLVC